MEQDLTATQTATRTATQDDEKVSVFQRKGSQNYYVRFRPHELALPLFQNRKDVWATTETSDKREAEQRGAEILAKLRESQRKYIEEFLPVARHKFLECKTNEARNEFALRIATGSLYEEFLKEQELLNLQLKVSGLGSFFAPSTAPQTATAPAPVSVPSGLASVVVPVPVNEATPVKTSAPQSASSTVATPTGQGITPAMVTKIFEFTSKKRRAGNATEAARAREGKRLVDWMLKNKVGELTPIHAKEYTSHLSTTWSHKTAAQRFSLTSYPFEIALKIGHEGRISIPYNPFADCGIISAAKEGVTSPREAITPEAFRKVLANLPSEQEDAATHWAIKIAAVTGLRITALATLTREDVKREANVVCLHVSADKEGTKTDISYWIPVHNVFAEDFFKWFESTTSRKVFNREGREISNRFTKLLAELDIKPAKAGNELSFHSLRHSNASWLKEIGIPTAHANAMQGRKEGGTLGRYGSLAGVLSYAGGVINAPLWWAEDYLQKLHEKASERWA